MGWVGLRVCNTYIHMHAALLVCCTSSVSAIMKLVYGQMCLRIGQVYCTHVPACCRTTTAQDQVLTRPFSPNCNQIAHSSLPFSLSLPLLSPHAPELGGVLVAVPGASHSLSDLLGNAKATRQLISEEGSQSTILTQAECLTHCS